jgi:hypothetical protein
MRRYSMRQAIRDCDAGNTPPELDVEAAAAGKLSVGVMNAVSQLCAKLAREDPKLEADVIAPALLQVAAMNLMIAYDMGPEDFGEFAAKVARTWQEDARRARARLARIGEA